MKKCLCLCCLILPLMALAHTDTTGNNSFVVNGKITGAAGEKIFLFNDVSSAPLDSVVITNDQFQFTGTVSGPEIYALFLQDHTTPYITVLTPGELSISSTGSTFPDVTMIKGSKESEAMQQYQQAFRPLSAKAKILNQQAANIAQDDTAAISNFRKKAEEFNEQVKATGLQFIHAHPQQIAAVLVLMNEMRTRLTPQELKTEFAALGNKVKASKYGKSAQQFIEAASFASEGTAAPDFTLNDVNGKPVSVSSFHGKYVLVDFWASWCGPCRAENPNVVAAYNEFKDKGFTVLGVSLDNKRGNWLQAIKDDKLNWTQVSDLHGWQNAAAVQYHVQSIPANFLLDPSGKIIAKNLRGEDLQNTLQEVLK